MIVVKGAILLSALDAIAIGPVPAVWLAALLPAAASLVFKVKYRAVPTSLLILLIWAVFVQIWSAFCSGLGICRTVEMPPLSTTPYAAFIMLRFLPFLMLISMLAVIAKLQHSQNELIEFVVRLGSFIAVIALYVYVAQLSGLPDIPRTRLGTDGLEVASVQFSYAFHRAIGTFREPSGMAVWLMLPLFLSIRKVDWRTFVMGGAILLSGSMTAFVAIAGGAVLGAIFLAVKSTKQKSWLLRLPVIIGLAIVSSGLIFSLLGQWNGENAGILSVINERLMPVVSEGVQESNRGYVFEFAEEIGIPWVGYGLGNINLLLTEWQRGVAVSGILSLYLNFIMGLGVLGISILIIFLSRPLTINVSKITASKAYPLYAAYFGWLIAFIIHSAEFPLMFALTYALIEGVKKNQINDVFLARGLRAYGPRLT